MAELCEDVHYTPHFLGNADTRYNDLASELGWREHSILMFGRRIMVPRLCAWYGDEGVRYRYSQTEHHSIGWHWRLVGLRDKLHARLGIRFNFVLANLYRDGSDTMGWHADDERELGDCPIIASLSFGAPRKFCLRGRFNQHRRVAVVLEPGSLLVMSGRSQRDWQHCVPRTRDAVGPRINLTFRIVATGS